MLKTAGRVKRLVALPHIIGDRKHGKIAAYFIYSLSIEHSELAYTAVFRSVFSVVGTGIRIGVLPFVIHRSHC